MRLTFSKINVFWIILIKCEIFATLNANQINLSSDKSNFYLERLQEDITFFNNYERSSPLLHNLQIKFKCCGLNGPQDYKTFMKPSSCFHETINHEDQESKGCAEKIKNHNPVYENECERIFDNYEYHRERFYVEMKYFEEQDSLPSWLDRIQTEYQCCGFNGPSDYKHFFKPSSCCDQTTNDMNLLNRCLNPPKDVEGSMGSSLHYYSQGCSNYLEPDVNDRKIEKNNETSCKNIFHQFELNREKFMEAVQHYDKNHDLPPWLDDIQAQNKCCGYNGPGDYAAFIKPASCRVLKKNNLELIQIVNQMDNSDEAVQYYIEGCGRIADENIIKSFNKEINLRKERNDVNLLLWIMVGAAVFLCFIVILILAIIFIWRCKPFDTSNPKKALRHRDTNQQLEEKCLFKENSDDSSLA